MRGCRPWLFVISLTGLAVLTACGDTGLTTDSTPPPPPPAPGDAFAVFTDPSTGFETVDVRDSENDIVRFDTAENALVWTESDLLFDGWVVDGNFLGAGRPYLVRFGNVNGERRAYFTETARGTLCELSVTDNELFIAPTDLLPPQ